MIRRRLSAMSLVGCFLLTGCVSSGSKYVRPKFEVPLRYKEQGQWKNAEPNDSQSKGPWWEMFDDALLNEFQMQLLQQNLTLKAAFARVEQARAIVKVSKSDTYPQLFSDAGGTRTGHSASGRFVQSRSTDNSFKLPLDLSYEIDLWGKYRRANEVASAEFQASHSDYNHTVLRLQAELARIYFELRAIDSEADSLQQAVDLRTEALKLIERRFEVGEISQLEVSQSKRELATTEVDLIGLQKRRSELEHAIAVLIGEVPSGFTVIPYPLKGEVPFIPPGLPSELLERRPDVSAAERRIAAENARIGLVQAARFPSISLTGDFGFESLELSDLFDWSSRAWSVGAGLLSPIYSGGRDTARLKESQARYDEAFALYRQQILQAFVEVEDSLAAIRILTEQSDAISRAYDAAQESADYARKRYETGLVNYMDVIDAERQLLAVKRSSDQNLGQRFQTTVLLIKALGGAWR